MKNFFKRFSVFLCLFSVLFCGFGGLESVSADDSSQYTYSFSWKYTFTDGAVYDYVTSYTFTTSGVYNAFGILNGDSSAVYDVWYIVSTAPITCSAASQVDSRTGGIVSLNTSNVFNLACDGYLLYFLYMGGCNSNTPSQMYEENLTCLPYTVRTLENTDCGGMVNNQARINKYYAGTVANVLYSVLTGNTVVDGLDVNLPDYSVSDTDSSGDVGSLDVTSLGYLQDVKLKVQSITPTNNANNVFRFSHITWGSKTSTGIRLNSSDTMVQYAVSMQLLNGSDTVLAQGSSDYYLNSDSDFGMSYYDNGVKDLYIGDRSSIIMDLKNKLLDDAGLSSSDFTLGNYSFKWQYWLRPYSISSSGVSYGGWTVLNVKNANYVTGETDTDVDSGTNEDTYINDDGNLDNVNDHDTNSSTAGSGSDADEAEDNSSFDKPDSSINIGDLEISTDDVSSITTSAKNFLSVIGNVPSIIKSLFSFLPDWCLSLVATGFALLVILIVYKLIRG